MRRRKSPPGISPLSARMTVEPGMSEHALAERYASVVSELSPMIAPLISGLLNRHLRQILGLDRKLRVAIVGAGNLGLALADYPGFRQEGFEIRALFDNLSTKVGQQSRGGVPILDIHDLKKFARRDAISIAVIAVPADSAQRVVDLVAPQDHEVPRHLVRGEVLSQGGRETCQVDGLIR